MNKAELLADLSTKVQAVGDNRLVSVDAIADVRVYDVDVYITTDADGTENLVTQRIHVHKESSPSEVAAYADRQRKNYVDPVPSIDGNKLVFEELNQMITDNQIQGYTFSHTVELAAGARAGVFTLIKPDNTESEMAYTVIDGQVVTADYKKVV